VVRGQHALPILHGKLKDEFIVFLGKDRLLKNVFACQWAGEFKPKAIARALKLPVRAIQHLQRRLKRRGTVFFHMKLPEKSESDQIIVGSK